MARKTEEQQLREENAALRARIQAIEKFRARTAAAMKAEEDAKPALAALDAEAGVIQWRNPRLSREAAFAEAAKQRPDLWLRCRREQGVER